MLTRTSAAINSETYYFPQPFGVDGRATGGIGTFQPQAAVDYQDVARLLVPDLVNGLVRNDMFTYRLSPASDECKMAGDRCLSTLLSGGLQNVSPWPFQTVIRDPRNLPFYTLEHAPSYHVDFWTSDQISEWDQDKCHVFGLNDNRFQICIDFRGGRKDQIISSKLCPTSRLVIVC